MILVHTDARDGIRDRIDHPPEVAAAIRNIGRTLNETPAAIEDRLRRGEAIQNGHASYSAIAEQ